MPPTVVLIGHFGGIKDRLNLKYMKLNLLERTKGIVKNEYILLELVRLPLFGGSGLAGRWPERSEGLEAGLPVFRLGQMSYSERSLEQNKTKVQGDWLAGTSLAAGRAERLDAAGEQKTKDGEADHPATGVS